MVEHILGSNMVHTLHTVHRSSTKDPRIVMNITSLSTDQLVVVGH